VHAGGVTVTMCWHWRGSSGAQAWLNTDHENCVRMQDSWDENMGKAADSLYDVSDMEGGEAGIDDEGEQSVQPALPSGAHAYDDADE
jgi:hypothetical protein